MILLFAVTTIALLTYSVLRKVYQEKSNGDVESSARFVFGTCFVAALYFAALAGKCKPLSVTALYAALYGAATFASYLFGLRALERGSYSLTMVVASLSCVIPTLSGLFFGERLGATQIVGVALVTLFLSLQVIENVKATSSKWLPNCIGMFLSTGALGVLQKCHQNSAGKDQRAEFLLVAFAVAFVLSALMYLAVHLTKKRAGEDEDTHAAEAKPALGSAAAVVLMLAAGICLALNNQLNLYLVGVTASALFFPLTNGVTATANIVLGRVLFREKFSVKNLLYMFLGIAAVVFVCLPTGS